MSPVILGTAAAGLFCIGRYDQKIVPDIKTTAVTAAAGIAGSRLLCWYMGPGEMLPRLLLSVVIGCLLLACLTDLAIYRVHNFVWWTAGGALGLLLFCGGGVYAERLREELPGILIFCILQLAVFGRMYGRADCYAFCVCAAAEAVMGMKPADFLSHMYFSFLLLVLVQAGRKNISSNGRLREPVPFLPYVTAGFYFTLIFDKICCETVVPLS